MANQPNYAILDNAAIGSSLRIDEGGLVLACDVSGTLHKCRATIPKTAGKWMFEVGYWGDDVPTGLVAFGICSALSTFTTGVGIDGSSYGYRAADGGVYQNNTLLAACPSTPVKTYIQVCVDLDASTISFYCKGGTLLAAQAISPATGGRIYYPAFTVGRLNFGINLYVNFGQRAFAYPIDGYDGWYSITSPPPSFYIGEIGDEAFSTAATDTPANVNYDPAWLNSDTWEFEKNVATWLHTDKSTSSSYGPFDIDNGLGRYWGMTENDYRDSLVVVRQLTPSDATLTVGSYTLVTALVDRIEAVGEDTMRVYVKDKLAKMQKPWQRRIFPPWADKGVAGRAYPSLIGAARSIPLSDFLTDSAAQTFQMTDFAATQIAAIRDMGNALDGSATPPQFAITEDGTVVVPVEMPKGKFTADASSCGAPVNYQGAPDVLNGAGSNWDTSWTTGNTPPGWVLTNITGTYTNTALRRVVGGHTWQVLSSNRPFTALGSNEFDIRSPTAILRAGKKYKISVQLYDMQTTGGRDGAGLVLISAQAGYLNAGQWISYRNQPLQAPTLSNQSYTLVYEVPAGADRFLYATVVAAAGGAMCTVLCRGLVVEELVDVVTDLPLTGATFSYLMQQILTNHAGLGSFEWSQSDCALIDAQYPNAPFGIYVANVASQEAVFRLPIDSVCGGVMTDRLGTIRIRSFRDPVLMTPVATYTETQIDYPVQVAQDTAVGLTTSVGSQHNWTLHADADVVSDTNLVPAAFRTQLKRTSRVLQTTPVQLRSTYLAAALANPLDTMFDPAPTAFAEITRVNKMYAVDRPGFRPPTWRIVTINYDGTPPEHLFADCIGLNYASPTQPNFLFVVQAQVAVYCVKVRPRRKKLVLTTLG